MALPKIILQLYPMFPADGEQGRKARRPLGADAEIYQRIVHEWTEIIEAADALGVWGVSTIEHHLHSEGYEVGPNKGIFELSRVYVEEAAKYGHRFRLGQRQNIVRWPHVTRTAAEYDRKLREYDLDIYKNFYGPFFPQFPQGDEHTIVQGMKDSQIFIGGTIGESIRQWRVIYDEVPAEYITVIWHWAQQPKDDMLEELRLFMEKVLPALEIPDFDRAAA